MRANEEFFDLLAGDIFARLYTSFPEPIDIHSDAILHNDRLGKQDGLGDDPGHLKQLYAHTAQWLADEGYLRFREVANQDSGSKAFLNAVLTAKGLGALRKTPGSLAGLGETLGDKIEETVRDIGSDTAKSLMRQLVGQALGWIVKGVTGL